jgi:hypothetical protein
MMRIIEGKAKPAFAIHGSGGSLIRLATADNRVFWQLLRYATQLPKNSKRWTQCFSPFNVQPIDIHNYKVYFI